MCTCKREITRKVKNYSFSRYLSCHRHNSHRRKRVALLLAMIPPPLWRETTTSLTLRKYIYLYFFLQAFEFSVRRHTKKNPVNSHISISNRAHTWDDWCNPNVLINLAQKKQHLNYKEQMWVLLSSGKNHIKSLEINLISDDRRVVVIVVRGRQLRALLCMWMKNAYFTEIRDRWAAIYDIRRTHTRKSSQLATSSKRELWRSSGNTPKCFTVKRDKFS